MVAIATSILNEAGEAILDDYQVTNITITREINKIPQAKMVIVDGGKAGLEFRLDASGEIAYGNKITIQVKYLLEDDLVEFVGIVTKKEIQAAAVGATYTVTLKDQVSILEYRHLPPEMGTLDDASAIDEVLNAASGDGVTGGDIDLGESSGNEEERQNNQVLPDNTKAWDFLVTRAEANGAAVVVENGELSMIQLPDANDDEADVDAVLMRDDMQDFSLKSEPRNRPNRVVAWAWDPENGGLVEQENSSSLSSEEQSGLGETEENFGAIAGDDPERANRRLESTMRYLGLSIDQGSLNVAGTPTFALLNVLELAELDSTVSIKHVLTGIIHNITTSGWKTTLKIGKGKESHAERFAMGQSPQHGGNARVDGLYLGRVVQLEEDPDENYRVAVAVPGLNSNSMFWARQATIDAGNGRGYWFRPEVDDEVVVGFVQGEGNNPVVLGSVYGSSRPPFEEWESFDDANSKKGFATKSGALIEWNDTADDKCIIRIKTASDTYITMDDDNEAIEIADVHGNTLVMNSDGVSITSAADLNLEAQGNVLVKGSAVSVEQ